MRRLERLTARAAAAGAALAAPLAALAAEVHEGQAEAPWSPFQGDVGNFLWTLVVFVLVLWVLGKWAWGPILAGLQGREQFIRDSLEQARRDRDEAGATLARYEERLARARGEVEAMIEEARRDAAVLRDREESAAREEARTILERARREIDLAKDTAVAELYERAAALATTAAGKILERELDPADHERLIAESIAAVERMERGRLSSH
jgi:F-type H+-transporting ATPase subunit b